MKTITLAIGLLVVGCGEGENGAYKHRPKQTDTNESTPTTNTNKVHGTTEKPVKELTLEEKVVGAYEIKEGEYTIKIILLENGGGEAYVNGKKQEERKWSVVKGEIHVKYDGVIYVIRVNKDKSITMIAEILDSKREEKPKEDQQTYKKIK